MYVKVGDFNMNLLTNPNTIEFSFTLDNMLVFWSFLRACLVACPTWLFTAVARFQKELKKRKVDPSEYSTSSEHFWPVTEGSTILV